VKMKYKNQVNFDDDNPKWVDLAQGVFDSEYDAIKAILALHCTVPDVTFRIMALNDAGDAEHVANVFYSWAAASYRFEDLGGNIFEV